VLCVFACHIASEHFVPLHLCPEKCEFEKEEVEYLGLVIQEGEVLMAPAKVKAVAEWPSPKNLKDV